LSIDSAKGREDRTAVPVVRLRSAIGSAVFDDLIQQLRRKSIHLSEEGEKDERGGEAEGKGRKKRREEEEGVWRKV